MWRAIARTNKQLIRFAPKKRRRFCIEEPHNCDALIAAAAASVAAGLLLWNTVVQNNRAEELEEVDRNCSEPRRKTRLPSPSPQSSTLFTLFATQIQPTSCQPHGRFSKFGLRRHRTVAQLNKTASKETLSSKYWVNWKQTLGQGAFGAVYLGTDRATGVPVAVKKITKKYTDNVSFQREMDALLKIRHCGGHPHICQLRENFEEGDFYYLVLDLVRGGEMFDRLCQAGAYSEADAARMLREVASALAFLHGIGIVHGDLKPENLMLSSDNPLSAVTKIVDFGCAQVVSDDEDPADLPGSRRGSVNTPAYCPPEVIKATKEKKIKKRKMKQMKQSSPKQQQQIMSDDDDIMDPSFDMWALGVILYIMLTGTHPFDIYGNATDGEIEANILSGHGPPLLNSPITEHLSKDAMAVIARLMQWSPKHRLTALELLEDPWVRGETARTHKMADSDKRLSAYRAFKTKIEAKVFADMVSWTDDIAATATAAAADAAADDIAKRTSLIERSFHALDPEHRGYVTTKDLIKLTKHQTSEKEGGSEDENLLQKGQEQLSLSGFSDLLAENMKNRYFPKGHVVYHEGDTGNVMYFINSGTIEVYTAAGFTKTLRTPGDFFGEGALMHPKRIRSASIRCVTPVHAIEVSREYFEKYLSAEQGCKLQLREKDKARKRQRAKTILTMQQNMKQVRLEPGEYLFRVGEAGNALYILEDGPVEIKVQGHTVLSLQPGELTGEHSLLFGRPRNVDVVCVSGEGCSLQALRARDFYALLEAHPSLKESIRDICLRREFQKALCVRFKRSFPHTEEELRAAFLAASTSDENKNIKSDGKDCPGSISLNEIRDMIREFDPTYGEADFRDILQSLDLNDSGGVTWEEFQRIFGVASSAHASTTDGTRSAENNGSKSKKKRR